MAMVVSGWDVFMYCSKELICLCCAKKNKRDQRSDGLDEGKESGEKPRIQLFFYCLLKIEIDIDGRKDARWDELSRSPPEYQLE